jgi:tRNA threonylcarbamoyladenosine biosynthesis protein TsaE
MISNSEEETEALAKEFAQDLRPGDWVGLTGPLGGGKSVWARGIGRGLGVTSHITSPTFTLVNMYDGRLPFCHVDLYRVSAAEELVDIEPGAIGDEQTVVVVEWADRLPDAGLPFRWSVNIERAGGHKRKITLWEFAGVNENGLRK